MYITFRVSRNVSQGWLTKRQGLHENNLTRQAFLIFFTPLPLRLRKVGPYL